MRYVVTLPRDPGGMNSSLPIGLQAQVVCVSSPLECELSLRHLVRAALESFSMGYGGKRGGRGGRGRGGGRSGEDQPNRRWRKGDDSDSDSSESSDSSDSSSASGGEEPRVLEIQRGAAGAMPPSESSDESSGDEGGKPSRRPVPGELPPNSSDEEESSDDDSDIQRPLPAMKTRQQLIEEREMAEQMAKLKLVKERREQQRLERIKAEGWDRFAPLTDDNHPPGTAPPSQLG